MPDFIDRNRLLKYIDNMRVKDCISNPVIETANTMQSLFKQVVEAMPKADTERHAHWIRYEHNSGIHCSKCNHKARYKDIHRFEYCPNCGRKMDEVINNE